MRPFFYQNIVLYFFMVLSYGYYAWLRLRHAAEIRSPREFYDTTEYQHIASQSLFSPEFWVAIRPPVIPLFYKIFGGNLESIVTAQLWISIISWGILALVMAFVIKNYFLKFPAFVAILTFSLVQNVILWDALVISESLALSILALLIASGLWLSAQWENYRFALLIICAVLLAFTRDTYAYFLLMCAGCIVPLLLLTYNRIRILAISGTFFILFVIVNVLSTVGMRWYTPFLMTVGLRILPNAEYVSYFESRGMPFSEELMARAGKPIQSDNIAMLYDPSLEEFRQWVSQNGRREYIRFLWFFKADAFQNPLQDVNYLFNPDVYYYAATGYIPIIEHQRLNEILYPFRFGLLAAVLYNAAALVLLYPAVQFRKQIWIIPLLLILLMYPQAVLIWNADAYEIARHSIHHNIMFRLGFLILTFCVSDFLIEKKLFMNRKMNYA